MPCKTATIGTRRVVVSPTRKITIQTQTGVGLADLGERARNATAVLSRANRPNCPGGKKPKSQIKKKTATQRKSARLNVFFLFRFPVSSNAEVKSGHFAGRFDTAHSAKPSYDEH